VPDLEIKDFSRGLTDNLESQDPSEFIEGDNLLIDYPSGDFMSRPGSIIQNETTPRLTEKRVSALINFGNDESLLGISERKVFVDQGVDGFNEIKGPQDNVAFPGQTADMVPSHFQVDGHLYVSTDDIENDGVPPIKIYKDQDGEFNLVTAGQPKYTNSVTAYEALTVVSAEIITLFNDIRTEMLTHYASTGGGGAHIATDNTASAEILVGPLSGGEDLDLVSLLVSRLKRAYMIHYGDAVQETGYRAIHSNDLGMHPGAPNIKISSVSKPTTWTEVAKDLNEIQKKHNWHVTSYNGHPNEIGESTATALTNTDNSPIISNTLPNQVLDLANKIKEKFNSHASGANHSTTYAFAGMADSSISIADATDKDTLIELASWIYAKYRDHNEDAELPVLYWDALTYQPTSKDLISFAPTFSTVYGHGVELYDQRDLSDDLGGLPYYVGNPDLSAATYGKNFAVGTYVLSQVISGTVQLTMSADNDASLADGSMRAYSFSKKRWHYYESGLVVSPSSMVPVVVDWDSIEDISYIWDLLSDIANKLDAHSSADGYHFVTVPAELVFLSGFPVTSFQNVLYAFAYSRSYMTLDGQTRSDIGSPLFIRVEISRSESQPISISNIKNLTNDSISNYDVINTKIDIYRSKNNGVNLYLVNQVTNDPSSSTNTGYDFLSDSDLDEQDPLYTNGGVVDNDPPPIAKVIHQARGFAYYGNLKVSDEYFPNRFGQSIASDPDSVPESFFSDLPNELIGISSTTRDTLAWTKSGTYRMEGSFDERGQGAIIAIPISETIGLYGGISPVQIDQGIVFAGSDGFYFTDAYSIKPLSLKFADTYLTIVKSMISAKRIIGTYDKINNRIYWACAFDGDECDRIFILDLNFGIREDGASFTTWSGDSSFAPSSICFFGGSLIRGDSRGYVLRHNEDYSDPTIDTAVDPSNWLTQAVIWTYISPAFDFGSKKINKWITKISIALANVGKTTFRIFRINEKGKSTNELANIQLSGVALGSRTEKRWMKAGSLRSMVTQIKLTNLDVGQNDEKTRISGYSLQFQPMGDSTSDKSDDLTELAGA
jgi:hypothetical protein